METNKDIIGNLSAEQISNKVNKGELLVSEIAKECIIKYKKYNKDFNAFISFNEKLIIENANNLDKRIEKGENLGKLAGVPVSIKDNIHVYGYKTTCASAILKEYDPCCNSYVAEKLISEGALIVGKTNLDEFASGFKSDTSYFGKTRNPVDRELSAGGSSGGSAVSTKLRISTLSIGSDTGGSVRQPSALVGVIGFKPSYDSISKHGLVPLASSLDTIGIFSEKIEDIIYSSSILYGQSEYDSGAIAHKKFEPTKERIKIGVLPLSSDDETSYAFDKALKKLGSHKDIEVHKAKMDSMELCMGAYAGICFSELYTNIARLDGSIIGPCHNGMKYEDNAKKYRDYLGNEVKARCISGQIALTSCTSSEKTLYELAINAREKISKELKSELSKYDVLISPTSPQHKILLNDTGKDFYDSETRITHPDIFTTPANFNHSPSISIPYGKTQLGIPLGMLVNGPQNEDEKLLYIAKKIHEILNY